MSISELRFILVLSTAAMALSGCGSLGDGGPEGSVDPVAAVSTDPAGRPAAIPGLTGSEALDPVTLGKRHYREGHFGLAEEHFRKAVELGPRDAEAWVGLAASYDRLRRFDLADRAYGKAIELVGPTATILNNQGYSYLLRGDLKKARAKLDAAAAKEPDNRTIEANLDTLRRSIALGKDVR